MPVSKRLRYEILRRDNHACRYCGGVAPDVVLTIDHVVPVALGGTDEARNLVAACRDCNAGKSSSTADAALVDDVSAADIQWGKAMQRVTEAAMSKRDQLVEVERAVAECFEGLMEYLPGDWYVSVDRFLAAGLTRSDLTDAAFIAIGAKHIPVRGMWRYFCGVCWRVLTERQEAARQLLDAEDADRIGS